MNNPELSIIIVDYNSDQYLLACLNSIISNSKLDFEVIIIDNNSTKDHTKEYEKVDKRIKAIRLDKNLGFGGANNLGARKAEGEYLLLLNPDTIVPDNSIDKMLHFITSHTEVGALTCLLGPDKDSLQKSFLGRFQSLSGLTIRRHNHPRIDPDKEFVYTDIVTGAALMIKKEIFDKIDGFDERFFMYLEDDDLCKRLVDAGYKNAVLNTAKIIHLEGKSSTDKDKKNFYYKSQDLYWKKHNGEVATLVMKSLRFFYRLF